MNKRYILMIGTLVLGLAAFAAAGSAEAATGLIGHWKFDEGTGQTAEDSSSSDLNGFINASVHAKGKIGGALEFSGGPSHVRVNNNTILNDIQDELTLSAWIRDEAGGEAVIVGKPYQASTYRTPYYSYVLRINDDGAPEFGLSIDGEYVFAASDDALKLDRWYHIAGVYDGNDLKIYVDGEKAGSTSAEGEIDLYSTALRIGSSESNSHDFHGAIDDVRLYNADLSASSVKKLYTDANPAPSPTVPTSTPATNEAATIAVLQKQIADLIKIVAELAAQIQAVVAARSGR